MSCNLFSFKPYLQYGVHSIAGCFNLAVFYLPIYFQAIKGASPVSFGVHIIPLILSLSMSSKTTALYYSDLSALAQIVVGTVITITGVFKPCLVIGPAVAAVGAGLLMLLNRETSTARWIGFQILLGVGAGCCLSIPLMLSQTENVVNTKDVSATTPVIICKTSLYFTPPSIPITSPTVAQSVGSAIVLPSAQGIFQSQLIKSLRQFIPEIQPLAVLAAGVVSSSISALPPSTLPGIKQSYMNAVRYALALGVPLAGLSLCISIFMPSFKYHNTI